MWAEALLGGLSGLGDGVSAYANEKKQERKEKEAAAIAAMKDKKDFERDVLKGVILQSMKPKSKQISFGDDLVDMAGGAFSPEFLKLLRGIGLGRSSGGGGGGGFGLKRNSGPIGVQGTIPGSIGPSQGPERVRLKL